MSTRVLIHHYSPTGTEEQWQRNARDGGCRAWRPSL